MEKNLPLIIQLPGQNDTGGAVSISSANIWNDISQNANNLTNIRLTQDSGSEVKINVKSIPSPFARMILFKNAFDEQYYFPNSMKEDIFEDILDTMEFLFLIKSTSYYEKMKIERIDLRDIESNSTMLKVHKNYLEVLKSFSETYLDQEENPQKYEMLTIIHFPKNETDNDSILCGSSPFTVFFTPENINLDLPGYFKKRMDNNGNRIFKQISSRNRVFLKFLISFKDKLPLSMSNFSTHIENKLQDFKLPLDDIKFVPTDFDYTREITIFPNIKFPIYNNNVDILSYYLLRPTLSPVNSSNQTEKYPIVLKKRIEVNKYYENNMFPENWDSVLENSLQTDIDCKRNVLPGTTTCYPWIYPEKDFLEDKLIKLPHKTDSYSMYDGNNNDSNDFHYLLPLKEKFFKYFKPEDVEKYFKYRIVNSSEDKIGADEVIVTLEIPIGYGNTSQILEIKKTYNSTTIDDSCYVQDKRSNKIIKQGAYLAIWPTILESTEEKRIDRYYILQYQKNMSIKDVWNDVLFYYYKNNKLLKSVNDSSSDENRDLVYSVDRNEQTKIFSLKYAPEIIQLETKEHFRGALLPNFKLTTSNQYFDNDTKLIVGIDFGTSNTVVAFKKNQERTDLLQIKKNDPLYTKIYSVINNEDKTNDGIKEFDKALNTFFIPLAHENSDGFGKPFSTEVCYISPLLNNHTILSSNITFVREIPGDNNNLIKTNLKWVNDEQENEKLVEMFFTELKCLIQKYAIENRIKPNNIYYRYSYPLAFTKPMRDGLEDIFKKHMISGQNSEGKIKSTDESICSQKYFTYLEEDNNNVFAISSNSPVITVDIGGGTSDIVGYSKKRLLFKNSILFGGQNIFKDIFATGSLNNPIVNELKRFLTNKLINNANLKDIYSEEIFNKYKDSHSLFSYIVAKEQFKELESDVRSSEFNVYFKLILLYFYSVIIYFTGLNIKKYYKDNNLDINDLNQTIIAFGGNSSRFLRWICHFKKWKDFDEDEGIHYYNQFLKDIFIKSLGINVNKFVIIQSSSPKEEVIKGLLHDDKEAEGIGRGEADINPLVCGEELEGDIKIEESDYINDKIKASNYTNFKFKDFDKSNIKLMNNEFIKSLENIEKYNLFPKKQTVSDFKNMLKNISMNDILDEINLIIQEYYAKKVNQNEPYQESYFITSAKACLNHIMRNTKTKE